MSGVPEDHQRHLPPPISEILSFKEGISSRVDIIEPNQGKQSNFRLPSLIFNENYSSHLLQTFRDKVIEMRPRFTAAGALNLPFYPEDELAIFFRWYLTLFPPSIHMRRISCFKAVILISGGQGKSGLQPPHLLTRLRNAFNSLLLFFNLNLLWIGYLNLGHASITSNLACHTNMLVTVFLFRLSEFVPVLPPYHHSKDLFWIGFVQV